MSVYVKDNSKLYDTAKELNDKNLTTLVIKDTLVDSGFAEYMRILKTITTLILIFVLFFISYVVIKIILKSRNTYYSIIRMLGGTKGITTQLLMIELITIANISYILYIIAILLNHNGIINFSIVKDVYDYFTLNDYIILYLIIVGMSILSSMRYSRKIFKDSVMKSLREEV